MRKPNPRGTRIERRRRNNLKAALSRARRPEGHSHHFRPLATIKRGGDFKKRARRAVLNGGPGTLVCHCGVARVPVNSKANEIAFAHCVGFPGPFERDKKAAA